MTHLLFGVVVTGVACVGGLLGTAVTRAFSVSKGILDTPSARSSHTIPMPRGGGVGVLGGIVAGLLAAAALDPEMARSFGVAHLCGGLAVAVAAFVGWLDDCFGVDVFQRIVAHSLAGLLMIPLVLKIVPQGSPLVLSGLVLLWWTFVTVAAINVTNFLDGIDGMVGLQAWVFGLHLATLAEEPWAQAGGLALAGSATGFLVHNWAPARIFLGDVGSYAIGVFGMLIALVVLADPQRGVIDVFLPLVPILIDASLTLGRRFARGERLQEAHREHLYQRAANGRWGHGRISLIYGVLAVLGALAVRVRGAAPAGAVVVIFLISLLFTGIVLERSLRVTQASSMTL